MIIIGCDFHTRYQQIAMLDDTTGELVERHLEHESGEAQKFYRDLSKPVRVGVEATGPLHWFERLLAELGHELWIGNSAKIRASEVRKQKTDERDARLILELMLANRFPRIWVPTPAERDLRRLLWHIRFSSSRPFPVFKNRSRLTAAAKDAVLLSMNEVPGPPMLCGNAQVRIVLSQALPEILCGTRVITARRAAAEDVDEWHLVWRARRDLNSRPSGSKPDALSN